MVFSIKSDSHQPSSSVSISQNETNNPVQQRLCCLIADDNGVNRMVMSKILVKLGIDAECAENGLVALNKLRKSSYDFAIIDCEMPVKSGPQAVSEYRMSENGKRLPIISWTASTDKEKLKACRESGMDASLEKPCTLLKVQKILLELKILQKK